MTLVAPLSVNDVSYVRRINHEIDFLWQAQYLVKFNGYFLWQAQHVVKFWKIALARNVVVFHTKCVSESPKRRVRDDDFVVGMSSNRFYIQGFSAGIFS